MVEANLTLKIASDTMGIGYLIFLRVVALVSFLEGKNIMAPTNRGVERDVALLHSPRGQYMK